MVSAVLVSLTSLYGVIGFALLLPAGIIAWRKRNELVGATSST
ncbi:MAG: LPXTG cell wall anchor domain-containing protein [Thaumarchaeota archaeon]|nr:MAG: LPXTG cell wall anchor domain-containing protein [Nitrososphaerota archaeon]